jgi:hypothetical protein
VWHGDSGGPTFQSFGSCQIGVHSRAWCGWGSWDTRVDAHAGWIRANAWEWINGCAPPPSVSPDDGSGYYYDSDPGAGE